MLKMLVLKTMLYNKKEFKYIITEFIYKGVSLKLLILFNK